MHLCENTGFNGGLKPDLLPYFQRSYQQKCYILDTSKILIYPWVHFSKIVFCKKIIPSQKSWRNHAQNF
ncbi:hypothetical protein GXM_06553 [Nostoc sphaeroides CCNUC1]|uniref:Uncharacterized protein n=1 Tax=Nostoc sphaeroides CCNUC1 TaxID=2653204 RepID=A0A5P8WAX6_9NOSO|nr:hypothetical protein GXM_06553 [Nostoc sphaeroides CCNUC1]